jgi:ERF superfamily
MNKSESIAKLALALSKAQSAISGAVKDSTNPFFSSKYANLESVVDAIRGPLADNELSFTQLTTKNEQGLFVNTLIMHSSGEWLEGSYPVVCAQPNDPQKLGAAMTYARRFSLSSAFGVPQVDDDGNTAAEKPKEKVEEKPKAKFDQSAALKHAALAPADKAKESKPSTKSQTDFLLRFAVGKGFTEDETLTMLKEKYKVESIDKLNMLQVQQALEGFGYVAKK